MKKRREEGGGQEWLNTYADMITLVLTFFVLLYSISNVNITKLEALASAMQRKLGIEVTTDLEDEPENLKYPTLEEGGDSMGQGAEADSGTNSGSISASRTMTAMAKEVQAYFDTDNVDAMVSSTKNAVYIRFKNDLLFGPDRAELQEDSKSMLDALGVMIKDRQDEIKVIYINGHTAKAANSPVNDRLLSSQRADNVAIYLEEKVGLDPKNLICCGYGKYYPIADNDTKEGREQNRRVDIIILGNDYKLSESSLEELEMMGPLFPTDIPADGGQEGTAQ